MTPHPFFRRLLACTLFLVLSVQGQAQSLQGLLDKLVREEEIPGAVLLVSSPKGREVVVSGVADLKTREAMREDTRFYIASSGKLMTSATVLQMAQEGKFKLQDKAIQHMDEFAGLRRIAQIERVSIAQLLQHRSGLPDYYGDAFEKAAARKPTKQWTVEESLQFILDEEPNARPGAAYEYVNTNYVLLGHLIASQDRSTYAQALQRRLFEPLGLTRTSVGASPTEPLLAHGYVQGRRGQPKDVSLSGWSAVTGDGAIVTTVADYARFLQALFADARLMPAVNVRNMCTRQKQEPDSDYGLGCMVMDTDGGDAWGHNGSIPGFSAETWYLPQSGTLIVLFANGDIDADSSDIVNKVLARISPRR